MNKTMQAPPRGSESSSSPGTSSGAPSETAVPSKTEQLIITRDAATGDVVGIEMTDGSGRTAISEESLRSIVGEDEFEELDAALSEAFDSGVTMVFEDSDGQNGSMDSVDRAALLRALVIALAGRQAMRRFARARRNLLQKLVLRRLVRRYFLRRRAAAS
jgi:hypothetical protein